LEVVDHKTLDLPRWPFDPFSYSRRASAAVEADGIPLGGTEPVRVVVTRETHDKLAHKIDKLGDYRPEIVLEQSGVVEIDPRDPDAVARLGSSPEPVLVAVADSCGLGVVDAHRLLASVIDPRHPILLKDTFGAPGADFLHNMLAAAANLGSLLCDGIGDAVMVRSEPAPGQSLRIAYNTLQAAGARIFKTDYVACPSCGRTLFNLQETTARIKAATGHLKGVRIAIMGCIVNGPGEMADADFGYVGGAPGKINLYVGKTPVKFNIPQAEAVDRLVDLIREHGRWIDPPVAA
jgi:(E)-4-hydroxy-3-methylbut-2-enyl-diphosphate synthase